MNHLTRPPRYREAELLFVSSAVMASRPAIDFQAKTSARRALWMDAKNV
jgi:hypothetical protein